MDLTRLVRLALGEDLGPGDVTTEVCVPVEQPGVAHILAKETLVLAGTAAAEEVFRQTGAVFEGLLLDGTRVAEGTLVARVSGPLRAILSGERTALNFLMRLSGIATNTRRYVEAAGGAFTVVDTRKTTPLHRVLEKAAVRAGGARNHRFGLFDGVLVKDNHIVAAGGAAEAVRRARAGLHHLLRIEVEATSVDEALQAIAAGADAILLDNMDDDSLARTIPALRKAAPRVILEVSGNLSPERLERFVQKGIRPDLASAGGLVHQARWVDLSLQIDAPGRVS
jgi:nicotinate-nucleotide pyrophosphorylase (carboxylating)